MVMGVSRLSGKEKVPPPAKFREIAGKSSPDVRKLDIAC
jgi:hypothetical protein